MGPPILFYYGKNDLSAGVFKKYMRVFGFRTLVIESRDELIRCVTSRATSITILAGSEPFDGLLQIARELKTLSRDEDYPLFVLSDGPNASNDDSIQVITRPYQLAHIAGIVHKFSGQKTIKRSTKDLPPRG